jgi:hypothetical protein
VLCRWRHYNPIDLDSNGIIAGLETVFHLGQVVVLTVIATALVLCVVFWLRKIRQLVPGAPTENVGLLHPLFAKLRQLRLSLRPLPITAILSVVGLLVSPLLPTSRYFTPPVVLLFSAA